MHAGTAGPFQVSLPGAAAHGGSHQLLKWIVASLLFLQSASAQTGTSASSFEVLSRKAAAARDGDRLEEAVTLYKQALALRSNWVEGWWSLGTIQYDRNSYSAAAQAFRRVIALDPKSGTARVMLGLCEFELGRDDSALQNIEAGKRTGIQQNPQLRKVMLFHEGILLQRKGKFEGAQSTLRQLCLEGVQSDEVETILGMVWLRMTTSKPPATRSLDADVVSRVGRTACLAGQRKYDEAGADITALVHKYPDFPNIHYARGMFLLEAHDLPGAEEEFKREIANHPDHVYARLQIAAAKYKVNSAAGLPFAQEAVKLAPGLPFAHYLLGLLYLDTDNYRNASQELEIAARYYSREPQVYFALGSAYSRAGRRQDAAKARATFERLNKEKESESEIHEEPGQEVNVRPPS